FIMFNNLDSFQPMKTDLECRAVGGLDVRMLPPVILELKYFILVSLPGNLSGLSWEFTDGRLFPALDGWQISGMKPHQYKSERGVISTVPSPIMVGCLGIKWYCLSGPPGLGLFHVVWGSPLGSAKPSGQRPPTCLKVTRHLAH
ncbi:hypothetical protein J6590_046572, partial [Homalodisca vitripennis]